MRVTAALIAGTMLALAGQASAADFDRGPGWRHHHGHEGYRRPLRGGHGWADQTVEVVEYREPYLPRGVLYNAPPVPLAYDYGYRAGYRDVISAKY